jgi:exodeoxyribonuclease V gamma subunit
MMDTPAFRILTAPRIAPLRDHLIAGLRAAPLPPREQEIIVVEGQGMRRWLTLQLADGLGCVGSVRFPFPSTLIHDISRRINGEPPALGDAGEPGDTDRFSRAVLTWRVDALLRALPVRDPVFEPLRKYIGDGDDRMRFGLAAKIADRFSDYQLFRADVLQAWEAGRDVPDTSHAKWQAALWRSLCKDEAGGAKHVGQRLRSAIDALQGDSVLGLPSRVTVFGVSALAPTFIEVLAGLARHIPVTVYAAVLDAPAVHPLATTFGAQSAEFVGLITGSGAEAIPLNVPADERPTLLHTLQRELSTQDPGVTPLTIDAGDASLRIHSAHGPMRQLEVLRDQLLAALDADPTLHPHDLLLLVPDVTEWGPLVDAVFGVPSDVAQWIPYRVADRTFRRTEPAAEAFSRLLALQGGRFARSEVFGLLATPLVRQAAELSDSAVEEMEALTRKANIRWGYDAEARGALKLPPYEEASWRLGLDRLLLGYATGPSDDEVLGVLPMSGDTAGETEALALLARWVDDLATMLASWKDDRTPAEWSAVLLGAASRFLRAEGENQKKTLLDLTKKIRLLGSLGATADYRATVSFGVVRDWLEAELDGDGFGSGFLGGMTVAALKPMHGIPFRVIAVAGLDDAAFPRRVRRPAFDLLEHERLPGDRDLRSDDRQQFLDLLLAAGDRLALAYTGKDVGDNSDCAPSVVIDELLDHLERRVGDGQASDVARKQLVVEHPLQPFSPLYFAGRDKRLFTYSQAQAKAAGASAARQDRDFPFVVPGTEAAAPAASAAEAVDREVALTDLVAFWTNPSEFYCKRVLGFSLPNDADQFADDEAFSLGSLTAGLVRSKLLPAALAGAHDEQEAREPRQERDLRRLRADGLLPPGALGLEWHRNLAAEVDEVVEDVLAQVPGLATPLSVPIAVSGDGWRLTGRIDALQGGQRVVVRAGGVRADHKIRCSVEHVAMCAAREAGVQGLPDRSLLIGKKGKPLILGPVKDAGAALTLLVAEMTRGLSAPLPFFPQAGWTWFDTVQASEAKKKKGKGATAKDPMTEAASAYWKASGPYSPLGGDGEDAYIALCFRGTDPFADRAQVQEFEQLTKALFSAWPVDGGAA